MDSNSIDILNLSKEYILNNSNTVKPLDNISLVIKKGETVGIIGKNGSGKSTLLKILSGLTKPTSGEIKLNGSISSILDIGSNISPELSGLENAEMHLRINGYSLKQCAAIIREIQDFSGIGDFFYQPIKMYSNGMFLRLAFSIVFNIPADILVLDEVLTVGDEEFQMKSFEFIKQLRAQGKTIVLVSHNRQEILELCTRCLWLSNGKIEMDGPPISVVSAYFEAQKGLFESEQERKGTLTTKYENEQGTIKVQWDAGNAPGAQNIFLRKFEILGGNGKSLSTAEQIFIRLVIDKQNSIVGLNFCIIFYNHFEQAVFYLGPLHTTKYDSTASHNSEVGNFEILCVIPPNLLNAGYYYVSFSYSDNPSVETKYANEIFRIEKGFKLKISSPEERIVYLIKEMDVSFLPFLDWEIKKI